jgi:alpha-L-arabinofuranosidase
MCSSVIDSDHYTIKCRARKDGGPEGFIIVFNYVDPQNYCWVNFGGWGNTQHAIEQVTSGGKLQTVTRRGKVETGRWYDVTLTVAGDSVKAWLDNDLMFDTVLKRNASLNVFSSATIDDGSGDLIVKIVNSQEEGTTARLNVQNFPVRSARLVRLQANSGEDENTLQQPTNIYPTQHELSPEGNTVEVELPAYSLNIIHLRK